jgi:hypothetical protein
MASTEHKDRPRPERRGIANPAALRDCLEAVDTAIVELGAVRQRYLEGMQDAFTPLRSSAQLFREIFFGAELPIRSKADLLEKCGGPYRLIPVTYKETGAMVVALGDVLEALPGLEKLYPIEDFTKLAEQLEALRESMDDHGTSWFVSTMKHTHLEQLLDPSRAKEDKNYARYVAILARPRRNLMSCSHCGTTHSPASTVVRAFDGLVLQASPERWTGRRIGPTGDSQ